MPPQKICTLCNRSPKKATYRICKSCEKYICDKSNCSYPCTTCGDPCCKNCLHPVVNRGGFHCKTCIQAHKWKINTEYMTYD